MTDRELMQMALDALDIFYEEYGWGKKQQKAHEALRARLAQSEPWVKTYSGGKPNYTQPIEREPILPGGGIGRHPDIPIKVQDEREENYKSFAQSAQVIGIPQREWVGLTEEEYEAIREDGQFGKGSIRFKNLFEAIEARLREKNS